jgi:ABC-type uncharacterized transport system involved in gliding motility auxiliary subunit
MRRLIDFLAPLGVLVAATALFLDRAGRPLPGKGEYYLIGGAVLVLAHLLLRYEEIAKALGARQIGYGSNLVVFTLVVLSILGVLNYLSARHSKRWDLTKNQRYSLSDQTKKILAGLKEDVNLTYFDASEGVARGQERLKPFEAVAPKLKVSYVDAKKNPARAREADVVSVPTLLFERGSRKEKITTDSEQDITNALIKVTRDAKKTVCFVEGEGERDIDDTGNAGYSKAKGALTGSQYEVKKALLLREKNVPSDCTVLVVSGPQKDLIPESIDAIRGWVKAGGKTMIMVKPEFKETYPNLTGLLKEWNIETAKDVVIDASGMGQMFGAGPLTPLAVHYPYHEITKNFRLATVFNEARSVEAGKANVPGVSVGNLVETSEKSWAESDLTLKEPIEFNQGKDRLGPISLGAVATIRAPEAKPDEGKADQPKVEGRVVALGDCDFASNALLTFQGNQDFFLNAVAWLAEDPDLISIRPKEPDDQRITGLSRGQEFLSFFLAIIFLPGAFLVLGVVQWWRRR